MVKIVIISSLIEENIYEEYQRKTGRFNPGQKFYQMLYTGLIKNNISVECYSIVDRSKQEFIDQYTNNTRFHYYVYRSKIERKTLAKKLANDLASIANNKDTYIIADGEAYWTLRAALYCKKISKCHVCEMITDFPHHVYSYSKERYSDFFIKKIFRYANAYYKLLAMKQADSFILLTEGMRDYIGKKKPSIIVEGFVEPSGFMDKKEENLLENRFVEIAYLGSLNEQSGILNFISAFSQIENDNVILKIYGDGRAREDIIAWEKKDKRIKYCGVVSLSEVRIVERQVDILINPRPSSEKFNRYSFPSKTLEYMSSGTAFCSTHLECIPKEYDNYIFWIDDTSISATKKSIEHILSLSKTELIEKGLSAKNFVDKQKTDEQQARKIITFLMGETHE